MLDIEHNELAAAAKKLHDSLPVNDRVELPQRPLDSSQLVTVIRNVQAEWLSSSRQHAFSRSMTLCDDFVSSVDSHSALLSALPECEFHLALFYSTVQLMIKVRVF